MSRPSQGRYALTILSPSFKSPSTGLPKKTSSCFPCPMSGWFHFQDPAHSFSHIFKSGYPSLETGYSSRNGDTIVNTPSNPGYRILSPRSLRSHGLLQSRQVSEPCNRRESLPYSTRSNSPNEVDHPAPLPRPMRTLQFLRPFHE